MTAGTSVLDEDSAAEALAAACRAVGLDPTDAELMRIGSSAVYRLASKPAIARVARSQSRLLHVQREVGVSRWLSGTEVPAVRALDVDQPVEAAGRVVSFWELVSATTQYGSTAELAALLVRLHSLAAPAEPALPALAPFDRAFDRLATLEVLPREDRRFLVDRCERLAAAYAELAYELPPGVIHGDASVGNVLRDDNGRAVLADLDGFAIGAREWDLVLTALYYQNFGWHTTDEYAAFVDGYGWDVMSWSGYSVLRDTRELLMVTWLAQNAAIDSSVRAELGKRIDTLRTGGSRRTWSPF